MEHLPLTALAGAALAAEKQGPGPLLRIVLGVLLVGAALMAWFLLRGYRSDRDPEADAGDGGTSPARDGSGPGDAGRRPRDAARGARPEDDRGTRPKDVPQENRPGDADSGAHHSRGAEAAVTEGEGATSESA